MTEVHARHRPAEFTTVSSASTSTSTASTSTQSSAISSKATSIPSFAASAPNNENLDIAMMMQEAPEMTKSNASSSSTSSTGSMIPKKRPPPPSSISTPLASFGNSVPPQPNSSVLGATASSHTANATKKPTPAATGAAAQKKRGLKRL